ncbi:MAG: DUF6167 family protein [Nocardioides sp.]|nr:DUF6167 family protein [Nocardioides sp.]
MNRGLWFLAGAGAGAYALTRARRAAEAFTPDGVRDRVAGLAVGARVLAEEYRTGQAEAEAEVRRRVDHRLLELATPPASSSAPLGVAEAHPTELPSPHLPPKDTHR